MILLTEFRQKYEKTIAEDMADDNRKLATLARAGLIDLKKLSLVQRAMNKGIEKLTPAEREMLIDVLHHLVDLVNSNSQLYAKVKQTVQQEAVSDESKKLTTLGRAGLYDIKKNLMLMRAMSKDTKKMSPAERGVLLDLLHRVVDLINANPQLYTKTKQAIREDFARPSDPPPIVLLRRKAIRIYPDGKKVALYYADKLDKYIPIPYEDMSKDKDDENLAVSEEFLLEGGGGVVSILRDIVANKSSEVVRFDDNDSMSVDLITAMAILNIRDSVNEGNKMKLDKMLNKNKTNFFKVAAFSHGAHAGGQ